MKWVGPEMLWPAHYPSPASPCPTPGSSLCCLPALPTYNRDLVEDIAKQHAEGKTERSAAHILVQPNGAHLSEIFGFMAAGKVKLEVAKVSWCAGQRLLGTLH